MRSTLTNTTIALQCAYKASWGDNSNVLITTLPRDLGFATWALERAIERELDLHTVISSRWEDNTKQVHDLLTWDVEIDALLMNSSFEEILKTATAYNGGTTPAWHDTVIYFIVFELGIDTIDVPEWWLEIL